MAHLFKAKYRIEMIRETISLLLFIFPLAWSPGPGNMYILANAARFGAKNTIPANLGYHLATFIILLLMGFGIGLVVNPEFLLIIKYAGAVFILYLAWKIANIDGLNVKNHTPHTGFWDGVILLLLNPKAYMIFAIILAQFINSPTENKIINIIWIASIFTLNNIFSFFVWAFLGEKIAHIFFMANKARYINYFFASILALVAIWLLLLD